jgi:hypothetical protein
MRHWVQRTTEAIQIERARGAAPDGAPAGDLATALNLMNERAMYASFAENEPAIGESNLVEVLLAVWLNSIYQTTKPPKRPGASGASAD